VQGGFSAGIHTHTTVLLLVWNMSGSTRVSRYQKGKTKKVQTHLDLLEQEIVSGSGFCWAICKSAPHPRQPRQHPTTQFFYRPDAIPDAQPTASKHCWDILQYIQQAVLNIFYLCCIRSMIHVCVHPFVARWLNRSLIWHRVYPWLVLHSVRREFQYFQK